MFSRNTVRSLSLFSGSIAAAAFSQTKNTSMTSAARAYLPTNPKGPFPYSKSDLTPMDSGNDAHFYTAPRFVTHIDDNAISSLKTYYDEQLPDKGRILDFCSSWISHYPPRIENAAQSGQLEVLGTGMNEQELRRNAVLKSYFIQDLNNDPEVKFAGGEQNPIDASTCVVSIDYLTSPVEVLTSIKNQTKRGGKVHLVISNRCFPTKAVRRWLEVNEEERLAMVGDYLHWAGWQDIEIVTVEAGSWMKDPLWVVRGTKDEA